MENSGFCTDNYILLRNRHSKVPFSVSLKQLFIMKNISIKCCQKCTHLLFFKYIFF